MPRNWFITLVSILTLLGTQTIMAEEQPTFSKACSSEAHRAFDFWIGEWEVTTPKRKDWKARSKITLGYGGCMIHEDYTSPQGYSGNSINFFDAKRQVWHQTWMDNQGAALFLEGEWSKGGMSLTDGINRITWSSLDDGRVRQLWETTADEGKTWKVAFDGYYKRVK